MQKDSRKHMTFPQIIATQAITAAVILILAIITKLLNPDLFGYIADFFYD